MTIAFNTAQQETICYLPLGKINTIVIIINGGFKVFDICH